MRPGFEGGQTPIAMRLGKQRGQYSKDAMPVGPHRTRVSAVNVRDLERFDGEVTPEMLKEAGLIRNTRLDVKILGHGELTKKLTVSAHLFSAGAREKIESAGGTITWLRGEPKPRPPKRREKPLPQPEESRRGRNAEEPSRRGRGAADRRAAARERGRDLAVFSWLTNAWRVPELRHRLLFTALILAIYRLGSWIPAPGVNSTAIKDYFDRPGGTVLGLLNLFSGGALSQFAIFALGIMPYVTASIILQLLTVVVPRLEQLQKEGEAGTPRSTSTRAT